MKMRARTILVACFAILTFNNIDTESVEVSSKVDFDSDENKETLSNATFVTIVKLNDSADLSKSISRASEPSRASWRHKSGLVKSNEPRKRRICSSQDDSTKQPKIINNIQIVINSNDSLPNENSCKDSGICDVSVSSKPDGKGNIVTEVHLSIITNAKPNAKIDDIPVIDSFQGIKDHEEKPIFHPISRNPLYSHRDNIPQIQTNYQGYGEPRYHHRTFQRPRTYWSYHHFRNGDNVEFRGRKIRPQDKPIVDDKIDPPLSRTKLSDDT
ncbi:hypothetical protein EAG_14392 [Camponotus floridanus]|uniref:Uncharacterized protein n=1 Tax=Camponotus floridanus TaxID=104421 RepID=E2ABN2_CAMFO|nr:uncharacterized protein LOC105250580 [Camponotus floridanus]EFN69134.1 hypothetical protein EAG_14392 [Camponotus floridanus]